MPLKLLRMVGALYSTELKEGDRVRGAISGIYLGEVVHARGNEVIVRGPNGLCFLLGRMMLNIIPPITEMGQARVWVM